MRIYFTFLALALLMNACSNSAKSPDPCGEASNQEVRVDTITVIDTVIFTDSLVDINSTVHLKLTRMNFVYKGVDNPIIVSCSDSSLKVSMKLSNGSISHVNGDKYMIRVKSGTSTVLDVINSDGEIISTQEFRVKNVPNPNPYFGGKSVADSKIRKRELTASQGVAARMENFDFDIKFTVSSFKLTMVVGGSLIEKNSNSNRLTADMKIMIKKAKPGSMIYLSNIKAKGPDDTVRSLGGLSLKVV